MKEEMVGMILAGGQGSRLGLLTKNLAKPAVYFGSKYRIIDFSLSNCANSGIGTIGILTQYKPFVLNNYIGFGDAWNLDNRKGGVSILSPFMNEKGGEWYKGTANAIYQNIDYVDMYDPEYVLVLSGDHIYTMDYSKMLDYHKAKGADATISVIEVPWEEASRFGIMNTKENGKIKEFEEKPDNPKNNLASMGIYIFNWKTLKEYLRKDEKNKKSDNDFGKNIIPQMLKDEIKLFAYNFKGYWKDVGTVETLWQTNMDLLDEDSELNLYDPSWKIYSVRPISPPQYLSSSAKVKQSMLNEGCIIHGEIEHSVVFNDVYVGKNSKISNSIIMPNVRIEDDVVINKAIIGEGAVINKGCVIGCEDKDSIRFKTNEINNDIVVVEEYSIIKENIKVGYNSIIGKEDMEKYTKKLVLKKEVAI